MQNRNNRAIKKIKNKTRSTEVCYLRWKENSNFRMTLRKVATTTIFFFFFKKVVLGMNGRSGVPESDQVCWRAIRCAGEPGSLLVIKEQGEGPRKSCVPPPWRTS